MENNWKIIAETILNKELEDDKLNSGITGEIVDAMLEAMNLVFEATKKECADKAECILTSNAKSNINHPLAKKYWNINKESILNINKPNL